MHWLMKNKKERGNIKNLYKMKNQTFKSYPNIIQSIGIGGIIILGLLIFSPVYAMLIKLIDKDASALIYYLLATGGAFLIINLIKRKKTGKISYNFEIKNKQIIPYVIIIPIFIYIGIIIPISASIELLFNDGKTISGSNIRIGIFNFIHFIIASPILEELIFGGIILNGLLKKHSPIKSILITSFIFGLIHLDIAQFVSAFTMGIFTGWIYYKTKSLTFSIVIHAITNLTALIMNHFNLYGFLKLLIVHGSTENILSIISIILGSISIILICIYFLKIKILKI